MRHSFRKSPRFSLRLAASVVLLTTACIILPARAVIHSEIIDFSVGALTAGEPVECTVSVTEAPANVVIYSDPPGAISFEGTVTSTTQAVQAATDANASGSVTLYARTADGTQVMAMESTMEVAEPAEPVDP